MKVDSAPDSALDWTLDWTLDWAGDWAGDCGIDCGGIFFEAIGSTEAEWRVIAANSL